ncbi:cellulose binding domain-containing protein [Actinoallomurus sp. NPDC050550]|uniref:cellulose binding domain-containing protein n=1 Tax=Actinoallomurus sp. NPDC050550 TaxID=3154937 RepID=UPI0033CE25C9
MDEAGASADPPPGPFPEADSPSAAGAPVEAGGSQAGAKRAVPATDVQVHPIIPPPRPYAAPVTVEEGIPLPPGGPHRPVAPPVAGRRPLARALWVGVILAGAVLMGVGFLLVYGGFAGGAKHPAPCGGKSCAPPPVRSAAPPGAQIGYRTVERDAGYFEGTVTIANHGDQPMRSWTLSFRYPGAEIHNTWDAVLQRRGEDAILTGTATARPIAPGAALEVRFGGSGAPSMPTDCRLNGATCAFVAR